MISKRVLAGLQGAYFLLTGVWPLVSLDTFIAVTGPKFDHLPKGTEDDHWLLYTVSLLIISVGLSLIVAAVRRNVAAESVTLAVASSVGLLSIDVIFVARRVILPVYLIDAVAEVILIALWIASLRSDRQQAV